MNDFETQVLSDLAALKTQMNALLGVGQPGRLHLLEERIERQESTVQQIKGFGGVLSILLTLVHVALEFFKR
jgi:hypothetical protein